MFYFFNDTATTVIYTDVHARSRREALPISDVRRAIPVDRGQRLTGAVVTRLVRRAKYGLIDTYRGDTLIFHLGMSGRWRIDPVEVLAHDHVLIETAEHRLALHDPRRFGSLDKIGRASCRERVCQYVEIWVVAGSLKKKK